MIPDELLVPGGIAALGLTAILILLSAALGIRAGVRSRRARRWYAAEYWHLYEQQEIAEQINCVVDDLRALDRKIHYRHNVHCPACGRFSRQAEGFPAGVADCRYHGIGIHVVERNVEIVMHEIPAEFSEMLVEVDVTTGAIPLVIDPPKVESLEELLTAPIMIIPDDLSEMEEPSESSTPAR